MLIYNTTYHVEDDVRANFLIWTRQYLIPTIAGEGTLGNPKLLEVLSHREEGSSCYTLQWEVADSASLHKWHLKQGTTINEQLTKTFKDKVVGFPTLLEVLDTEQ
ncbi:MAG TPA: DUF4286 family protein [Candidatus Avibacteroides excrementipullorum]|jgi:FMN phosphatase YigB (HAD superfamily)|nr:DUF4286 family protein [Candidatus Avibacteroides excrementipullorum]